MAQEYAIVLLDTLKKLQATVNSSLNFTQIQLAMVSIPINVNQLSSFGMNQKKVVSLVLKLTQNLTLTLTTNVNVLEIITMTNIQKNVKIIVLSQLKTLIMITSHFNALVTLDMKDMKTPV